MAPTVLNLGLGLRIFQLSSNQNISGIAVHMKHMLLCVSIPLYAIFCTWHRATMGQGVQKPSPARLVRPNGETKQTTRSLPRWDLDHFTLLDFMNHLQGFLGKRRSRKEAIAVATDVSKFLAFCSKSIQGNTLGPLH